MLDGGRKPRSRTVRLVANAMARRVPAPTVKAIVHAAAIGTLKGPRSGPLVRQLHDFFELRAVTAVSAIAWLRLSDRSSHRRR